MRKNIFIFLIYLLLITSFINKVNAQESMQQPPEIEIKTDTEEYVLEEYVLIEEISVEQESLGEQSSIEKMYNVRSDRPLKQFGYSFFKRAVVKGIMPVGDEYTMGPGDTVVIYFWGDPVDILGLKGFYSLSIDRDGKIFVPNLGVFYVWGLNVSQTKDIIYRAMAKKFKQFEIEVTLGKLRVFTVYVSGYVKQPGVVLATGVYSALDVLTSAGGIEKNGSLRDIVLRRVEKTKIVEIEMNLYDLLIYGKPVNIKVKEGDTIFVNPVGKTSGISGVIKRPAIYELAGESNMEDLISLSGGILPSAYSVGIKLIRYEEDTLKIYEGNLKDKAFLKTPLNDGDFVLIEGLYDLIANEINIEGHIAYPGKYSFKESMKLSDLLGKIGILPDTNLDLAEIRREKQNEIVNFSPVDILSGKSDVLLEKRDTITFYPERVYKPVQVAGEVENPVLTPYYPGITLLDVLNSVNFKGDVKGLKAEVYSEENKKYRAVYLYDLMIRAL
ncbi:MAG: SLBB domain-containing protein, partial [Spirochaetes bacterium]|nr:SLBB domain-containing protein [Spirochaetota bacterium]